MSARAIRRLLVIVKTLRTVFLLAIPIAVIAFLVRKPSAPNIAVATAVPTPVTKPTASTSHDLAWYAPLWERDLKQPAIPKQAPAPAPTVEGPVPILLATLVEPDGCFAHLVGRSGNPQMKTIDESIDQFQIKAIEPGRVQLQTGQRQVWVEIPKPKDRH